VLRRPIETTAVTGQVDGPEKPLSENPTYRELAAWGDDKFRVALHGGVIAWWLGPKRRLFGDAEIAGPAATAQAQNHSGLVNRQRQLVRFDFDVAAVFQRLCVWTVFR
jgi:hypothetical protein